MSLKESRNGRPIVLCNRKTGFVGVYVCIISPITVYDYLMKNLQYCQVSVYFQVLPRQSRIVFFFGKVRRICGCNNNPTARQFTSAFKKLVVRSDLQDVLRENCMPLEAVPILTATSNFLVHENTNPPLCRCTKQYSKHISAYHVRLDVDDILLLLSHIDEENVWE